MKKSFISRIAAAVLAALIAVLPLDVSGTFGRVEAEREISLAGATGSATERTIWNYLYDRIANAFGTAGLMGNLYAESALKSNNLQNSYESSLGMTDEQYTAAVDNGTYTGFVYDSAGYGLAQWTYYSRKQGLLNRASAAGTSIGDLEMQLGYLWKELTENYPSLVNTLRNATSIESASTAVLTQFERPANQGQAVQSLRASYGQTYYDLYAIGNQATYDYAAAAKYGLDHAYDTPQYSGGDCANFVSHCLAAGGVTVLNSSSYYSSSTLSYQNCSGSLGSYRNPYIASAAQLLYLSEFYEVIASPTFSQIELGDIVFMRSKTGSSPDTHVVIITGFNGSQPLFSGHTTARRDYPLGAGVATYVVKMRRPINGSGAQTSDLVSDSKYSAFKGFKAYPCVSQNFVCYNRDLTSSPGKIYVNDYCTINDVYTNGWCQVTCPWSNGQTKIVYTQISNFIKTPSAAIGSFTADRYINLYSTQSLSTQIFRVYPSDICYTIGSYGSSTQIFMPHVNGYYVLGWIPSSSLTNQGSSGGFTVNQAYPTPFNCRIISNSKVRAYTYPSGGSSPGYVYVNDDCVIREIYSGPSGYEGWVKFDCPWMDGTTKTLYIKLEEFIHYPWVEPYQMTAPKYALTYLKSDKATQIGWIDPGDNITVVSVEGNMTQIIYPANTGSGKRCAWVDSSALTAQYTVTFNGNGATGGVPSPQTKLSTDGLVLSSSVPYRTGYNFAGWGTSPYATAPTYYPGSTYYDNANITLYALWAPQTYAITFNENGGWGAPAAQLQTYGTPVTLTNTTPTKAYTVTYDANGGTTTVFMSARDCKFNCWNTDSSGNGTSVNPGEAYMPNSDTVLYAIYSNPIFGAYPIPQRDGYTFLGWYTAAVGGTKYNSTTTLTSDINLYAHWEEVAVTSPPATQAPATQAPATQVPATQAPATQPPATQAPATQAPATQAPATQPPVTQTPTTDVGSAHFTVASVSGTPGSNVSVAFDISGDYAANSLTVLIKYDAERLSLGSIARGFVWNCMLDAGGYVLEENSTPGEVGFIAILPLDAVSREGTLFTMNFSILSSAPMGKDIPVTVEVREFFNYAQDGDVIDIPFTVTDGKVNVIGVPGDVNGDGRLTMADAIMAMRYSLGLIRLDASQMYAADINGDGKVNAVDALYMMRVSMGVI